MRYPDEWAEPTDAELAAIERESDLIDAEIALVDAEILLLTAEPGPTALDWHRVRRAEARVLRELLKLHAAGLATEAVAA
ncbi:DUF6284 family protein [Dactylosporangium sp. AC04546]|uniref:DUF6284 family protein n=1 Tax=Dactylosporangium sp. AC04546 TaxID=2862460 RepID=UPI001EDD7ADE|nr:DUF6284 family protein [Dactylosporangium sp. AC04546]WVK83951.1 DUF6284 family protein [Dactylosporangium sp. AC04546]